MRAEGHAGNKFAVLMHVMKSSFCDGQSSLVVDAEAAGPEIACAHDVISVPTASKP